MNLRPSFLLTLALSTVFAACGGADPGEEEATAPAPGGEAAEVGKAQQEAHTGCRVASDCDDGLYCNGQEICVILPVLWNTVGSCLPALTAPICNDGIACTTDSCSEVVRGCRYLPADADGDGHHDARCKDANGDPLGDDCDDRNSSRFPGNLEICDADDEDCDPDTIGHRDGDGDGYVSSSCCNGGNCGNDCNDARSDTHPVNVDPCDDRDNDCDGQIDENCQDVECAGEVGLYPDADGDGFGAVGSSPVNACSGAGQLSPLANDCDDTNPAVKPGASACSGTGVRTCGSDGQLRTAACPGILPRCLPQPNGTGICTSL